MHKRCKMKKEIITVITILIIGLLSGCSMLDDILGHKTYEVSFITNKEATLESINITDFTTYNFNESHIPVVVGEDFLGWYLDDSFNNAYEPNHSYDTDLVLYAQFKPLVFNVSIKDTYTFMTYNYEISYGQTLESIDLYHEGLILVGFKTIDTDLDVAIDDVVTSDLFLYTVFLPIHTHALVNFVVNDDFNIPPQVVLKSSEITMPQIEVLEHQILIGWYKDSSFNQLFDFDELIESNLTLYAKIIDKVETSYSMEDNVLSR